MKKYCRQIKPCGVILSVITLLFGFSNVGTCEDITPFRLTGIDGYVGVNYLSDSERQDSGGSTAKNAITTVQEEIFINTHSYIYHPNFLKMDLGGGPLFVQDRIEAGGLANRESSELYNFAGRLSFLEQKSTPFAFYYEHLNPTVTTSLTQSFIQTNVKKGVTLTVREPLSPVLITAEAFQQRSTGSSASLVVDDNLDQASVRATSNFGADNTGQLFYQVSRLQTASGNTGFTINPSQVDSHNASFDGRFLFGTSKQFSYNQVINVSSLSFSRPDYLLDHKDLRFSPDIRWQHSENLSTFYNYNLYKSKETSNETIYASDVEATNQSGRVGVNYSDADRLSLATDVHATDDRITGWNARSKGIGAHGNYLQPWENVTLRFGAGITYDSNDRNIVASYIAVKGTAPITLDVNVAVTLPHDFIDISTIRIWDTAHNQEYTENPPVSYKVTVIGSKTQIERLDTVTLPSQVLVDYSVRTGGPAQYSYTSLNQNYQASLTLYRNYTVYVRYLVASYDVVTGTPTLPFNSSHNTLFGLRVDQPLFNSMTIGGEAMFERQDEELAPYRRQSYDTYVQFPVVARMSPRFSLRRQLVDYSNSSEDVDLIGWSMQINAHPWNYTSVTAEASYEKDTGGSLRRVILRDSLGIEWRFRQLSLRGDAQYVHEMLGTYDRNRSLIKFTARRDF